jgi:LacI family transcriptional regulator
VGLMACSDQRGQHVLDACNRVDLAVPEEVAVIGVDDDAVLCNLSHPAMSSVVPNAERVGYEAAALLDRLMGGEKAPAEEMLVEPLGVMTRQSTDVLAIDDAAVASVVRFIRERACKGCSMKEVERFSPMSRSVLERQFRKYLGRSPQAEIRAVQLKRVKQLLTESELSLERIAALAGYSHPEYMSVVFKRDTGITPGQYRAGTRGSAGGRRALEAGRRKAQIKQGEDNGTSRGRAPSSSAMTPRAKDLKNKSRILIAPTASRIKFTVIAAGS